MIHPRAPVAQLDRAIDYGSIGWGFESLQAHVPIRVSEGMDRTDDIKKGICQVLKLGSDPCIHGLLAPGLKMRKYRMKRRMFSAVLALTCFVGLVMAAGDHVGAPSRAGRGVMVGLNVARFIADGIDESTLPPSLALVKRPSSTGPLSPEWNVKVTFSSSLQSFSAFIHADPGTSLYGTGEIAGPLLRNGRITEAWNTDTPSYGEGNGHLYQSHPWVLAVRADGSAYGVLADTTYRCKIDLRDGIGFRTTGKPFPVYVIAAGSPQAVLMKLAELTGHMSLPPLWSLGYHQCRWSYYPDARVRQIADEFRARRIPCDVIWLDIHYMDGYRIFTFDPRRFPDPKAVNQYLHDKDFKTVWMIDPGVKKEKGYFVYDQGSAGDHWVLDHKGKEFNGNVWPGPCVFPDFTRPETREWWGGLYRDFLANGVDGVWNDMNEPSLLQTKTPTMPTTNLHRGGGDLPAGDHAFYHNVYGMLMVRSTREGMMRFKPERRPFVLTRSNYIGGQRYAATWTGDNVASWSHLGYSATMTLNMGMSGQPFVGPDIGGFNGPGTPQMFRRWIGVGAFFPFCRGHAAQDNIDKEPWAFGPEVEKTARVALERRYRLLPYYYTVFREASVSGLPVMRPLFFADPADPGLRREYEAFLIGADMMVIAQLSAKADHRHRLPKGIWRPFTLVGESPAKDPCQPELRIRGGAIIPLGRLIQSTAQKSLDPLTLLISLDNEGTASGTLYEDAGDGWGFQKGEYLLTRYSATSRDGKVSVRIEKSEGSMPRPARKLIVELVTDKGWFRGEGDESAPVVMAAKY